ncbi:MAG: asparagine synthetase B, partial [Candidatus Omnitrophota bacterium]
MCGILGALYFNGQQADARDLLRAAQWMSHRGPDDEGVWVKDSVGFAHKRLSILDLSCAGHQPMVSEDGQSVIVYNGECYNFQALREDLEKKGCHFRSGTDTEVILCGIQEYGVSFVNKMNGMFAFAIWSEKTKELLIFRDRLGVKP